MFKGSMSGGSRTTNEIPCGRRACQGYGRKVRALSQGWIRGSEGDSGMIKGKASKDSRTANKIARGQACAPSGWWSRKCERRNEMVAESTHHSLYVLGCAKGTATQGIVLHLNCSGGLISDGTKGAR